MLSRYSACEKTVDTKNPPQNINFEIKIQLKYTKKHQLRKIRWYWNARLQPNDSVRVEQGFDLGLRDAEAEVGHELLPGVRLDYPGEDGDVLLALQPAADYLHQLKKKKIENMQSRKFAN